jgi:hypothetical protein
MNVVSLPPVLWLLLQALHFLKAVATQRRKTPLLQTLTPFPTL